MPDAETFRGALALARADFDRRLRLEGVRPSAVQYLRLLLHAGARGVLLFRLDTVFHARRWRILSFLGHLAIYFLGRHEVHAGARIGPGLVLPDLAGVGIPAFCTIGRNCTFLGPALLTIGGMEGIDIENDRIVIGDDCIIGPLARIIGAITLGDGTQVKDGSVVMTSFPKEGHVLWGMPARRRGVVPVERLREWSPLLGAPLPESVRAMP